MQGNRLPSWYTLTKWLVAVLFFAFLFWGNVPIAADDSGMNPNPMERQLQAYQSQYNLIKAVQKRLDAYGYQPGPLDGILGAKTKAALMAFQKDNGLPADGMIGIKTLERLNLIRE